MVRSARTRPLYGRGAGSPPNRAPDSIRLRRRLPQFRDIDLLHLHHRLHHTASLRLVRLLQEFGKSPGHYLPRDAVLVGKPAALVVLAAVAERVPVVIDFVLRRAV